MKTTFILFAVLCLVLLTESPAKGERHLTYRHFEVVEQNGKVASIKPLRAEPPPLWARDVSQGAHKWAKPDPSIPYFTGPIPFVVAPRKDSGEPFYPHNHQPDIAWLKNGDLLAIWYTTEEESGPELTVLASRLRADKQEWDPAAEFFKANNRNMHGNSLFHDGRGTIHHINGMGRDGAKGWANLALLHRYSTDNGVTWSVARPIADGAEYANRHQVIAGMKLTKKDALIQLCDATPGGKGDSAVYIGRNRGRDWTGTGGDIRGIHAAVVELTDGSFLGFGRDQAISGRMPMSVSADMGNTWQYTASEFPPISSGQRLVLMRLREGPLLLVSFTNYGYRDKKTGMTFLDANGQEFTGIGMYAALSRDEGKTWPVQKLITPAFGKYNGGGHTKEFEASPTRAEHGGYLAATQTPDGVIHLISSRLHYRFNLKWLETRPILVP